MAFIAGAPYSWGKQDVRDWITWCTNEYSLGLSESQLDTFGMNGKALLMLKREDFCDRVPGVGDVIFNVLHHVVAKYQVVYAPYTCLPATSHLDVCPATCTQTLTSDMLISSHGTLLHENGAQIAVGLCDRQFHKVLNHNDDLHEHYPDEGTQTHNIPKPIPIRHSISEVKSEQPLTVTASMHNGFINKCDTFPPADVTSVIDPRFDESVESGDRPKNSTSDNIPLPLKKRPRSLQSIDQPDLRIDQDHTCQTPPHVPHDEHNTKVKDVVPANNKLLWEFIAELLGQPNRELPVRWIDQSTLTFRISDPAMLAQLWGGQKHKANMTYEKLSRALRYYYKMNIIGKVIGKKLTYKFTTPPPKIVKGVRGAKPGVPHKRRNKEEKPIKQSEPEILDLSMKSSKKQTARRKQRISSETTLLGSSSSSDSGIDVEFKQNSSDQEMFESLSVDSSFIGYTYLNSGCLDLSYTHLRTNDEMLPVKQHSCATTLNCLNNCSSPVDMHCGIYDKNPFQSDRSAFTTVKRPDHNIAMTTASCDITSGDNSEDYVAYVLGNNDPC